MNDDNLKTKAAKSIFWSAAEKLSLSGIGFFFNIYLARILFPADFGIFAIMRIIISLGQMIMDSGLTVSIIQKKDAIEKDYSTIFFASLFMGTLFFIMLFFSAPFLEKYFQIQSFSTLAQITGLTIVFNSLGSIQQARYTKELDYAKVTISSGTATLIAGITAAVFARQGAGVFSLAIFLVLQSLIRNALLWLQTDFYPLPQFSWQRFRPLFRYSSKIFLAGGLNWVFDNLYHFSIGKFFSVIDLGFYSQARRIQEFGSHNISSMIQTVAFPTFSKIQNDPRYLKKMFINTIHLSSFVVTPLMITLLVFSEPIILLLLTEKWLSAALYLKILAIVGLLAPLHSINMNVIKAKGRSGVFLNYEIAKKLVIIVAFIVGFQYGITGLVVSQAVASMINLLINTRFSGQNMQFGAKQQLLVLLQYLVITLPIFACAYILHSIQMVEEIIPFILFLLLGNVIYLGLAATLKRIGFFQFREILKVLIQDYRS
jgi:teichuronic acid exporter